MSIFIGQLLRAHVKLLRVHVNFIACARKAILVRVHVEAGTSGNKQNALHYCIDVRIFLNKDDAKYAETGFAQKAESRLAYHIVTSHVY